MNYGESGYSLADIKAVTDGNNNGYGNGMFGGDWAWIIVLFLIFGWGGYGNGFGNRGGNGSQGGVMDAYVLNSDFSQLSRQVDSGFDRIGNRIENVNNGLCDGFYAVNTAFGNLNTTLCSQFGNTNNLITQNGYESRLATQTLASQLANCCCEEKSAIADLGYRLQDCCCTTQRAIDGVNYNMAMNTNALQNAMCNNTRDIVENANNNTRQIIDFLVNDKISTLQAENQSLRLSASQERQNNYLIDQLKPCPIPAYITCNPYQSYGYGFNNGGCGCGNNF